MKSIIFYYLISLLSLFLLRIEILWKSSIRFHAGARVWHVSSVYEVVRTYTAGIDTSALSRHRLERILH